MQIYPQRYSNRLVYIYVCVRNLSVAFVEMNTDYNEMKAHIKEVMSELEVHHKLTGEPEESNVFGIIMKISFNARYWRP